MKQHRVHVDFAQACIILCFVFHSDSKFMCVIYFKIAHMSGARNVVCCIVALTVVSIGQSIASSVPSGIDIMNFTHACPFFVGWRFGSVGLFYNVPMANRSGIMNSMGNMCVHLNQIFRGSC